MRLPLTNRHTWSHTFDTHVHTTEHNNSFPPKFLGPKRSCSCPFEPLLPTVLVGKVLENDPRFVVLHTPPPHTEITTQNHNKDMDVNIKGFDTNQHTVEVGADDTVEGLRRKVATAMGLPEDSFCMSFGDEAMGEGADMTQLSAGDTIILTKTKKGAINV